MVVCIFSEYAAYRKDVSSSLVLSDSKISFLKKVTDLAIIYD